MNEYGVFVLATILFNYVVHLVADILNIGALTSKIPAEFKGVYDEEEYAKSQKYTRAKVVFSQVSGLFDLALLFGLWWYLGGYNLLDQYAQKISDNYLIQGIAFMQLLVVCETVLSLPSDLYHTFVLEERFGFNKTTLSTFVIDRLKSLFLSALLGSPLVAAILWFLQNSGPQAWLYCWAVGSGFVLLFNLIFPVLILPFFFTLTPLPEGELQTAIREFAKKVSFSFGGIFEMDGSRRSSHSNAFFAGFGASKRIVLFDTLIKSQTIPELLAVLAHEMGHYKMRHIIHGMVFSCVNLGMIFYVISLFVSTQQLFDAFFVDRLSLHVGMLLASKMFGPLSFIISIVANIRSRKHEFEADKFSVENHGDGSELVSALKKLSKKNLSNLTPHPLNVFLNHSHPPVLKRIEAIREIAHKLH
eukprot:c158_g1_i1.p1 GENE.c158_g1_i1~~c158_g1_i1.p1  ORF type:complete len:417 (-),score=110.61 c158_g1_i1:50-1300(-)